MNKRFTIGGVPEHFNLPWRLLLEEGTLNKENIKLHWSDMTGGTGQMIKGLETGTLDIAVLLTEGVTMAILKGLKAKIVSVYVESPLCWGVHVPYDSVYNSIEELKDKVFAISREGSGSHLMTYIKALELGWDIDQMKFNVIGDIYGGIWALQNQAADGFLWEKYTTDPFVVQGKCRRIGEIITPWPCFVVAVREEILESNHVELNKIMELVLGRAKQLKKDTNAPDIFAWRYNLTNSEVSNWLNETNWSYEQTIPKEKFEEVVDYLAKTGLVHNKQTENWMDKLFINNSKSGF